MNTREITGHILNELDHSLNSIDPESTESLIDLITNAKKIFVAGAGRSKLMIRGFAMRLMHLGYQAYVVGETVTPAIDKEDLLIIGSGSGETGTLKVMAAKAKTIGARLALITIYPDSSIGKLADNIIKITAATTKTQDGGLARSIQPGANMFEQSLLLICDAIVIRMIEKFNFSETNQQLMKRHANLE